MKALFISRKELVDDIMEHLSNSGPSSYFLDQVGLPTQPQMENIRSNIQRDPTFMESQLPSLTQAAISAQEAAQRIQGLSPELVSTMNAYKKSAESISDAAKHFSSMIEDLKKMLEVIPSVQPFLSKILDAITIVYDVVMSLINKAFYLVPSLLVRLFQLFGIDTIVINQFVARFITLQCSPKIVQGNVNGRAEGATYINMMTEAIGTLMLGRLPDEKQIKHVNDALRYKNGLLKEATDLGQLALLAIRSVPDQIQIWLSYIVPTKWWLDIFAPGSKYYEWINEVNQLDSHEFTVKAAYEHKVQQKVLKLYKLGQQLMKECTEQGIRTPQVYRLLEGTFKKLDALYKIVDMSTLTRGTRPVPFVIYLCGPTGQGKSFLMGILPPILANCSPEEPNLHGRLKALLVPDSFTGKG
jgi:hypothetical protein